MSMNNEAMVAIQADKWFQLAKQKAAQYAM
jgi:hypothetical protein